MTLSALRAPLTVEGDTLGSPVILRVPEKETRIRCRCGSWETVLEQTPQGEFRWTPPLSLAQAYPRDNRIPVELTLELQSGARLLTRQERVFLKLPEEIIPQVVLCYADALGYRQTYGGFVQGKSRLTLGVQTAGTFGAGIRRVELRCGELTGIGNDLTFDLPQAGSIHLAARVEDDRGRVGQAMGTLTVLPYEKPTGEILCVEGNRVQYLGRVTALGEGNQGNVTLLVDRKGETERLPAGTGWECGGEIEIPNLEAGDKLGLEVRDDFEAVVIPYDPAPFLDMRPDCRALGLGCRADRESAVCLGLPLDMGGAPIEHLGNPQSPGDALPLGYADSTYWHPRLLWENPSPKAGFPAQSLPIQGDFLLIEAAEEAGKDKIFWEVGKEQGLIRAPSGVTRTFRQTEAGLTFGTTTKGNSWAVPLRVYG